MTEQPPSFGPIYDRRAEIAAILSEDETLLGRVYRYDLQGLTPLQQAEAENNENVGFVYNYRTQIKAILAVEIPNSPSISLQTARRVSKWQKTKSLSADLMRDLAELEALLRLKAEDADAQESELDEAVKESKTAEEAATPGVYVYTLPHYLIHRFDELTGKTLLKVGHSSTDAYYRVGSAGRLTALPEDPILLRIYPAIASAAVEKQFHEWLRSADHASGRGRRVGAEWFVTSTKFLDQVAKSLGLEIQVFNQQFGTGDE